MKWRKRKEAARRYQTENFAFHNVNKIRFFNLPCNKVILLNTVTNMKRKLFYTNGDLKFVSTIQAKGFIYF